MSDSDAAIEQDDCDHKWVASGVWRHPESHAPHRVWVCGNCRAWTAEPLARANYVEYHETEMFKNE